MKSHRLFLLTLLALLAFAGNSLLCRIALKQTSHRPGDLHVDPHRLAAPSPCG